MLTLKPRCLSAAGYSCTLTISFVTLYTGFYESIFRRGGAERRFRDQSLASSYSCQPTSKISLERLQAFHAVFGPGTTELGWHPQLRGLELGLARHPIGGRTSFPPRATLGSRAVHTNFKMEVSCNTRRIRPRAMTREGDVADRLYLSLVGWHVHVLHIGVWIRQTGQ
jgi:hypothetical protein